MRNSEEREQNDTTNDRRNGQGHQRATAGGAGIDPAGLVLDGAFLRVGDWSDAARSVGALPDAKGLQMGGDAKDSQLAASA